MNDSRPWVRPAMFNGCDAIVQFDPVSPLPANLVTPHGRLSVPNVRSFVDFATPRLREYFEPARRITDAE